MYFSGRFFCVARLVAVGVGLLFVLLCVCPAAPATAASTGPWTPPKNPADIPLPRSAKLSVDADDADNRVAIKAPAGSNEALRNVVLGVIEVLAGKHRQGAARLESALPLAGDMADVAAYYQGLGLYLADDPAGAVAALSGLAGRPSGSFLGHDALYLAVESAGRAGQYDKALTFAQAWLTEPEALLAPEIWLRAAVAATQLGNRRKADDFLRHLSLTWPNTKAAASGDALARTLCAAAAGNPETSPALSPDASPGASGDGDGPARIGCYDPDAPRNVLLRAEALVEKGSPQGALDLLTGKTGFDAGQAARAEYIRGKAQFRLRRPQAAAAAFVKAAEADPTATLAFWARYQEARCLWRSFDAQDGQRAEALLRQVLASPVRDDPLREVAARNLALFLVERGRFAEALEAATQLKGLAVPPELAAQGAALTAILRFVVGDMAGAVEDMTAFIKRFPEDDWSDGARYWRGKALAALGRPEEAAASWIEAVSRRPNTYYGGKSAAALAGFGPTRKTVVASPVIAAVRCPDASEPPSRQAQTALEKARTFADVGLPTLSEMLLEYESKTHPERADLAMAHIRAAVEAGRRTAALRTAWRTFGGCLLRGSAESLAPLRPALFPRAYEAQVRTALVGSGIKPDTIYSLIRQESFFEPSVVSGAGAVGLMQLMPETAKTVGRKLGIKVVREDLFNPAINIRLGVTFFRERVAREGSLAAALASYNAGENRVALWNTALAPLGEELFIELIPYTETRDYVRRITTNAMLYGRLYAH